MTLLRSARGPGGLAAAILLLVAAPAFGQRVQFPSVVPEGSPYYAGQAPAVLDGTIQTPPPTWDPYADPSIPSSVVTPSPYAGIGQPPAIDGVVTPETRLVQNVSTTYTWLADAGGTKFQTQDVDLAVSLALPMWFSAEPVMLTPGFNFHFWDGPPGGPVPPIDLPARVYDAFLATSWKPQFTPWLGMDLGVSVGVYSDFQFVDSDSIRVLGRALGVFSFSQQWQMQLGIVYLDRMGTKLLPAGGFVWTPNADARYEFLFPRPKLAQRVTSIGNTDVWGYLAGEYGGGQWTVEHSAGMHDTVNYNDLRVIVGVEFLSLQGTKGFLEFAYVWDREIVYYIGAPTVKPGDTAMIRTGFAF